MSQPIILAQIAIERGRQDAKWGGPENDSERTHRSWISLIREHQDRATKAIPHHGQGDLDEYRNQLIQIAAIAVAAIESLDRERG